ncbi:MAG: class I SAM-dependent methyltransferase [Flavobacteriaceae bacterium]|nr:class I SAM-dependent methyltransferase [Flavobacteriaceae bacterium]
MTTTSKWFKSWFNTAYYHLLYNKRDYKEASFFMSNLVSYLKLKQDDSILDLACGKGRHAIFLNSLGFEVTGLDLSENSINDALKYANESLQFRVHDMRLPFINKYNAIFNLFTSFGYFETEEEDISVLKNIKNGLKQNGIAVIDYLNVSKSIKQLIPHEIQKRGAIDFEIKRQVKDGFINKKINFKDAGNSFTFTEHVKCLDLITFKKYLKTSGLKLIAVFGDYKLHAFNEESSDRLILIIK